MMKHVLAGCCRMLAQSYRASESCNEAECTTAIVLPKFEPPLQVKKRARSLEQEAEGQAPCLLAAVVASACENQGGSGSLCLHCQLPSCPAAQHWPSQTQIQNQVWKSQLCAFSFLQQNPSLFRRSIASTVHEKQRPEGTKQQCKKEQTLFHGLFRSYACCRDVML